MATNRLFIYDPQTKKAAMIARGFSGSWLSHGSSSVINAFFEDTVEFTGNIDATRYQLKIEGDFPEGTEVYFENEKRIFKP